MRNPRNALWMFRGFFIKIERKIRQNFVRTKKSNNFATANADMAQLVEQRIRNAWVPGSSPGIGSVCVSHIVRD